MKTAKLNLPKWVGELSVKKTEFDNLYKKVIHNSVLKDYNGTQNPGEFFGMWGILSQYIIQKKLKKVTFLEIGAYKGLWALMLSHICDKLNVDYEYTTVTALSQDSNNDLVGINNYYIANKKSFNVIDKYSQDPTVVNDLKSKYNFVFIDGGRSYDEVFCDFMVYSKFCKSILFWHDIISKEVHKASGDADIFMHGQFLVNKGLGIHYVDNEWFIKYRWNVDSSKLIFSY